MATKNNKSPAKSKRTKADVQQAFEEIQEKVTAARESADTKSETLARMQENEIRTAFQDFTVEGVVTRISELNVQIGRALSGIGEQLSDEVRRLVTAREAVEIEKRELEQLHKIDIAATSLDQLLQEHEQKSREFKSEMGARRAAWDEEAKRRDREQREFDEGLKKARQREAEDFEYKRSIERKKSQDKHEEEQRLLDRRNQEKQEQLEKSWQQRELALKEKEEEFKKLQKEAQTFPDRLQQEVQKAVSEAVKSAESRHGHEKLLLQKEAEAEKRVSELRSKTLEETVVALRSQVESLEKRLEDAKAQVQSIAIKAIEGASGARALDHVNLIAMEQAKQRGQQS